MIPDPLQDLRSFNKFKTVKENYKLLNKLEDYFKKAENPDNPLKGIVCKIINNEAPQIELSKEEAALVEKPYVMSILKIVMDEVGVEKEIDFHLDTDGISYLIIK